MFKYRAVKKRMYRKLETKLGWRIAKCCYPLIFFFIAIFSWMNNAYHDQDGGIFGFWIGFGILFYPVFRRWFAYIYFGSKKKYKVE